MREVFAVVCAPYDGFPSFITDMFEDENDANKCAFEHNQDELHSKWKDHYYVETYFVKPKVEWERY